MPVMLRQAIIIEIINMINRPLIYSSIFISCALTLVLTFLPHFDIKFNELFYSEVSGFIYKRNWLVEFFYLSIPILTKYFLIFLALLLTYKALKFSDFKNLMSSYVIYLLIAAALGPGLIVNYVLKENFYRARPSQIEYFNGSKNFSKAFVISDQCDTNCSFSSGHAAMAFYFTSLAYALVIARKNKASNNNLKLNFTSVYTLGIIFGSLVGLSRILMGRHFLSDVTTSCAIVLIINHLLYECWKKIK